MLFTGEERFEVNGDFFKKQNGINFEFFDCVFNLDVDPYTLQLTWQDVRNLAIQDPMVKQYFASMESEDFAIEVREKRAW